MPTDQSIHLTGSVTTSVLDHLRIPVNQLHRSRDSITSGQTAILEQNYYDNVVLIATTVFNSSSEPYAEDQWRAASAILDCAEHLKCNLVFVPPLGRGTFDWPCRQAVVNWLFGATKWCRNHVTLTNSSVWPVICVLGPGDQTIVGHYLDALTNEKIQTLQEGKVTLKVRLNGVESEEIQVHNDILLGAVAKTAFRSLERGNHRFYHGAKLRRKSTGQQFEYNSDTPLAKTIFADGDVIDIY